GLPTAGGRMSEDVSGVRRRMIERSRRPLSWLEPLIPPRYAPGAGGSPGDAAGLTPDPGPLTAAASNLPDAPTHDGANESGITAASETISRESISRETGAAGAARPATAGASAAVTAAAASARHDAEATRPAHITPGAGTPGDGTEGARAARVPGQGAR